MFRLFLRKKVFSGDKAQAKGGKSAPAREIVEQGLRNRRLFTRYSIDHKHLTLMNEQDILLIKEISAKGFSTEVSPRGYERLKVGDVYDARIRYLGEIYDLRARVAWKHHNIVGFEITKADRETLLFIKRLLRPIEIAASLKPVDAAFLSQSSSGKTWYHGDEDADLFTWHDESRGELKAWQLTFGNHYVEWSENRGLQTGSLAAIQGREVLMGANLQGLTHNRDLEIDPQKRQFAIDVIMALPYPVKEEILATVTR